MPSPPKRVHGSMLNKIVASDLLGERELCNFDVSELKKVIFASPEVEKE